MLGGCGEFGTRGDWDHVRVNLVRCAMWFMSNIVMAAIVGPIIALAAVIGLGSVFGSF
ncbi:MAG: hypothetical protein JO122_15700 [Acetobacteraceae bacterium]|nr:hypothetical protein [Acetobacteraceae bacterium]